MTLISVPQRTYSLGILWCNSCSWVVKSCWSKSEEYIAETHHHTKFGDSLRSNKPSNLHSIFIATLIKPWFDCLVSIVKHFIIDTPVVILNWYFLKFWNHFQIVLLHFPRHSWLIDVTLKLIFSSTLCQNMLKYSSDLILCRVDTVMFMRHWPSVPEILDAHCDLATETYKYFKTNFKNEV